MHRRSWSEAILSMVVVPSVLRVFAFRRVKFSLCVDQVYSSVILCSEPDVRHRVLLCCLNISRIRPLPRSATYTDYSDVHVSQESYMHPIKYFPGLVWRRRGSLPLTPRAVAMKRIRQDVLYSARAGSIIAFIMHGYTESATKMHTYKIYNIGNAGKVTTLPRWYHL